MNHMNSDTRDILYLCLADGNRTMVEVGRDGVTVIKPYDENGQMAPVPWFAVFNGDVLANRINAAHVETVGYAR